MFLLGFPYPWLSAPQSTLAAGPICQGTKDAENVAQHSSLCIKTLLVFFSWDRTLQNPLHIFCSLRAPPLSASVWFSNAEWCFPGQSLGSALGAPLLAVQPPPSPLPPQGPASIGNGQDFLLPSNPFRSLRAWRSPFLLCACLSASQSPGDRAGPGWPRHSHLCIGSAHHVAGGWPGHGCCRRGIWAREACLGLLDEGAVGLRDGQVGLEQLFELKA